MVRSHLRRNQHLYFQTKRLGTTFKPLPLKCILSSKASEAIKKLSQRMGFNSAKNVDLCLRNWSTSGSMLRLFITK